MKNKQLKNIKQYSKVALIISCVFAVAASALIAVSIYGLPQAVTGRQEMKYLYENGVEVDAHYKYYYDDYRLTTPSDPYMRIWRGRFHIVY
ncbi:MAG: hypothetical protein K2N52_02370 [Clostridia bacterium]|nr:hypothetical protein [Clostridia bacterium]